MNKTSQKAENIELKKPVLKTPEDEVKKRVAEIRAARAKRRNSPVRRDVLRYPEIPGFKTRVFNNVKTRIEDMEARGWSVVYSDETGGVLTARDPKKPGTATTKIVGTDKNGPVTGVLMKIPEEIYDEDQEEKHNRYDEMVERIEAENKQKFPTVI